MSVNLCEGERKKKRIKRKKNPGIAGACSNTATLKEGIRRARQGGKGLRGGIINIIRREGLFFFFFYGEGGRMDDGRSL